MARKAMVLEVSERVDISVRRIANGWIVSKTTEKTERGKDFPSFTTEETFSESEPKIEISSAG